MSDEVAAEFEPARNVRSEKAADIRADVRDEGAVVTQSFELRQPEKDWNDFQVGVRASVLHETRMKLRGIQQSGFPWGELLLGLGTLTAGGSISALLAEVPLESGLGIVFYIVAPCTTVGSIVAYVMYRVNRIRTSRHLATDVLDALPDPDKTL